MKINSLNLNNNDLILRRNLARFGLQDLGDLLLDLLELFIGGVNLAQFGDVNLTGLFSSVNVSVLNKMVA